MYQISQNLLEIHQKISITGNNCQLVAVSKYQSVEKIEQAILAGQYIYGENKVQEALQKWPKLKSRYDNIKLRLIGSLQTNKIKEALSIFDVIETVDRKKLADSLLKHMTEMNKWPDCLIQVNTGNEEQKSGISTKDADNFINYCIDIGLPVKGLMCIPPKDTNPTPYFKKLKEMACTHNLHVLSMGMSGDYIEAIKAGATHVRIGTAIFGERK